MIPQIQEIAMRLKDLRDTHGLSPETLAHELKIPADTYRAYENGTADIPVSVLIEAAARFNVQLTSLLTGEEPKLKVYHLVKKDKGLAVNRSAGYAYQDLAFNFQGKKAEVFKVTVKPGVEGSVNSHPGQEFQFLLEGSMEVTIDGHPVVMNAGDSLYFDSGFEHTIRCLSAGPARFLAVIL